MMKFRVNSRLNKRGVRYFLSLLFAGISIYVLFRLIQGNLDELKNAIEHIKILPLLISFPIFITTTFLSSVVWGQMMKAMGVQIDWTAHSLIYLTTAFAGRIPGGIWNIVGRITWYDQIGVSKRKTSFVSAIQWFILLWSGSLIILFGLPFLVGYQNKIYPFVIPILMSGAILHPKIYEFILKRIFCINDVTQPKYGDIILWLIEYIFIWGLGGLILLVVVHSLYPLNFSSLLLTINAWCVGGVSGNLVTFLPSGFGLSEVGISLILTLQIPSAIAVISALIMRVLFTFYEFIISAIGYFIYTRTKL